MQTAARSWFSQFLSFLGGSFLILLLLGFLSSLLLVGRDGKSGHGNIALISVEGTLEAELSGQTIKKLIDFRADRAIKAIVMRIDSAGGPIAPAQELYVEVLKTVKKKPVVVSMGSVAASGGYYAAAAASKIVANPSSITGSLGVIMEHYMVDAIARRFQLRWEIIKAGEVKDMGSPLRDFTAKERAILTNLSHEMHEQFIADVASGRKMPVEEVRKLASGEIFSGTQAKKLKLIDAIGSEQQAIEMAAQLVDIKEADIKVVDSRQTKDFAERILEKLLGNTASQIAAAIATGATSQPVRFETRLP